MTNKIFKIASFTALCAVTFLSSCREATPDDSRVKWGFVNGGLTANILNLEPNQSVAVCAPSEDWVVNANAAMEQWSTVIGRWGHFKVKNCGETADLTINMEGFGSYGLNYYNANPGKIQLLSSASGPLLTALSLHEYGHSFGMCDQYPSVNNCTQLSSQKNNNEVMGSTHQGKVKLTAGDIEGIKAIAANQELEVNLTWQKFLSTSPKPNGDVPAGGDEPVYVQVLDGVDASTLKLQISVPAGSKLTLCADSSSAFGGSSTSSCNSGSSNEIAVTKDSPIGDRDTYIANTPNSSIITAGKMIFIAKIESSNESKNSKFSVTKK